MAVSRVAYPARFTVAADGSVAVGFRDLPEALTSGDNLDEALAEASDCLDVALSYRMTRSQDVPPPSPTRRGERLIAPPAQTAAKLALYVSQRAAGLSNVALAKRLGCDEKAVRRLLDPRHASRLDRLADAIHATGGRLELHLRAPTSERKSA
ncbi:MAG: type II toxin-antitoxin system HicB family antitoxin [Proteobacteria bacterium]|nr:type II toxin-antitoxin system HicB family antitoxin [Pseudomonadota bacterium]